MTYIVIRDLFRVYSLNVPEEDFSEGGYKVSVDSLNQQPTQLGRS
jgi:hypothetical protein